MKNSILKKIVLSINILVIVILLLSVLAQFISPAKIPVLSYLGMFFLPFALLNVCFILFWIANVKWYFLLSLVSLFLVSGSINSSFSFRLKNTKSNESGKEIKVMTYNVMLFDYYKKGSKALDYIANSDADVVCLQEFGWHKNGREFLSYDNIISKLSKFPYHHINIALDGGKVTYGIATFSKFPIINKQTISYESDFNSSVYSDIKAYGDTIRIFNNHLESNKLTKQDKDNLVEKVDSDVISRMAQKLKRATALRADQADRVSAEVKQSPYPVIVCGDFNDIPVSYTYKTISRELSDPFIGSGYGMGITYSENLYRFRIDYILADRSMQYYDYTINNTGYSDHYPVSCVLTLPADAATSEEESNN